MGQLIRPSPFVFYHNPLPPGPEDTKVQEDGQDRREGGWERELDLRVVAVPGV